MHGTKIHKIHKIQNNKKSKKQKQKTPTKCKSKLLTVEWHKEAADQISESCKIEKYIEYKNAENIKNRKCQIQKIYNIQKIQNTKANY